MPPVLHIVAFDVPYPPNYGGAIDVFYKLKALHRTGVHIIFHCFDYGRNHQPELAKYCQAVHYYPRSSFWKSTISNVPHIVLSRQCDELLDNLKSVDAPILFDGIHCTYYLDHAELEQRKKYVRMHNVEWQYYQNLADADTSNLRRMYLEREANLLKPYEAILQKAAGIFCITPNDRDYYRKEGFTQSELVNVFHGNRQVETQIGSGDFVLYQGNLSVVENEKAVHYILEELAPYLPLPLVIAGKQPGPRIRRGCRDKEVDLIADPDQDTLDKLISDAHIHLLPTFQGTGIKLKLINALYRGRHILVNETMVAGTGIESLCHLAQDREDFIKQAARLKDLEMVDAEIQTRSKLMQQYFDDDANGERLKEFIFPSS